MFVVSIINSIVGKPGNIGFRFQYIKDKLDCEGVENYTIARGNYKNKANVISLGLLGFIPRGLHYIRRNYFRKLNTRAIDIFIFDVFNLIVCPYIFYRSRRYNSKVLYLVESSPLIIKLYKVFGFRVIVDLPIAPNSYVKKALDEYKTKELVYHQSLDKKEQKVLHLADKILVPSKFVFDEVYELLGTDEKIVLIPFGVALKNNDIKHIGFNKENEGVDFVFAGNVSSRKGVNFLIDAWNDPEFETDRLHLCGNVYRDIERKIKNSGIKNIILPGFVKTIEYFESCDIYVFPSLMEGSSKSIYEAMNSGLPSIVTYQSGSIIKHDYDGLIINAFSVTELRSAMKRMKKLDYKAYGKRAKAKVEAYTWDAYSDKVFLEIGKYR